MLSPLPATHSTLTLPYLGYDPSTFELAGQTPRGVVRQTSESIQASFAQRVAVEKERKELAVYYYRVNHTLAFPLPLTSRPVDFPPGIPGMTNYPWLTWLAWALEERWVLLLAAWVQLDDEAGELMQRELAALDGWDSFTDASGVPSLALGHIAGVLATALQYSEHLDPLHAAAIRRAATQLIDQDTLPWYAEHWAKLQEPLEPKNLHNIPTIALARSAQLARAIGHASAEQLDACAAMALRAWCKHRLNTNAPHTESTAYDGFLMDSVTAWLDTTPLRDNLLAECQPAFFSLVDHWLAMALPGRLDLQIPLSDVEPEMPYWINALARLAAWYGHEQGGWLLQHLPPDRMPATALTLLLARPERLAVQTQPPTAGAPLSTPNAVVLRSGWDSADISVAIGAGQSRMSHLHQDSGSVVVAWQNRCWITDPGYQQYRKGEERDFTMGIAAHNAPVIGGIVQTLRASNLVSLANDERGQSASIELTHCYAGLPESAHIQRQLWLSPFPTAATQPYLIVADAFHGFAERTEIEISWQLGTHLAVAFQDGWLRLSDGEHTLWMTTSDRALASQNLSRHAGSRGPLTLSHRYTLPAAEHRFGWLFFFNPAIVWSPPTHDEVRQATDKVVGLT